MSNLELSLVWVLDKKTGIKRYYGVNNKHYDAMLCGEIEGLDWGWLGDVLISEEILNEQGLFYKDE